MRCSTCSASSSTAAAQHCSHCAACMSGSANGGHLWLSAGGTAGPARFRSDISDCTARCLRAAPAGSACSIQRACTAACRPSGIAGNCRGGRRDAARILCICLQPAFLHPQLIVIRSFRRTWVRSGALNDTWCMHLAQDWQFRGLIKQGTVPEQAPAGTRRGARSWRRCCAWQRRG